MRGKLNENERNEWLKNKFLKLAEKKGWEGPYFHVAEQAFFEGASLTALDAGRKKLGEKYDRRRKLTDKQKDRIMLERAYGEKLSVLAEKYGVSQSLIYLICNPEAYKESKKRAAEWSRFNNSNKKESSRRTYIYKRDLVIKGLI